MAAAAQSAFGRSQLPSTRRRWISTTWLGGSTERWFFSSGIRSGQAPMASGLGNPFEERPPWIARMDLLSPDEELLTRLEQRFGRLHRIGQTEVCHLWNLLAQRAQVRQGMDAATVEQLRQRMEPAMA